MTAPRTVTSQEARAWAMSGVDSVGTARLLHTIATEPDRTRAAVVKALRNISPFFDEDGVWLSERANAIENGADW